MTKKEGLMIDCLRRCHENHLLTYEDLVNTCPDLIIMLESQPGGSKLIEQTLHMMHIKIAQTHTAMSFIQTRYADDAITGQNKVFRLLAFQGYNPWQVGHWVCCLLSKQSGKQNSLSLYGPASTGKTNLAKAIVNCVKLYGNVNHLNKNFVFNDCAAKLIIWWEEALMHCDYVEQAKCLLGGTEFRVDRKHKDSQLLPQTPVIISTNNNIYEVTGGNTVTGVHSKPLRERIVQLNLMKQLPATFGEISCDEVAAWLLACKARYRIGLTDFYEQWTLGTVPNDFPLANPCAGHLQDLVLDDCGVCDVCGCRKPLDHDWTVAVPTAETPPATPRTGRDTFKILTPTKIHFWCTEFDLSYLDSPGTPGRKRDLDEKVSKSPASPRPSTPSAPKKPKRKLSLEVREADCWASQPQDELEILQYETGLQDKEQLQEPEPVTSSTGLTPTEWGKRLGVISQGPEQSPIVLHCFETIPESEDDSN